MNLAMQQRMCFDQKKIAIWLRISSLLIHPTHSFLLLFGKGLLLVKQFKIISTGWGGMQHLIVLFLLVPATAFDLLETVISLKTISNPRNYTLCKPNLRNNFSICQITLWLCNQMEMQQLVLLQFYMRSVFSVNFQNKSFCSGQQIFTLNIVFLSALIKQPCPIQDLL